MEQLSSYPCPVKSELWLPGNGKPMSRNFLLVGSHLESVWVATLHSGLRPLGNLEVVSADEVLERIRERSYDLIIVDTIAVSDVAQMISQLRRSNPLVPVVVVTASPTWQRAKEAFLTGAADYIYKSLDADTLYKMFNEILSRNP